jgi:hypothetical protein
VRGCEQLNPAPAGFEFQLEVEGESAFELGVEGEGARGGFGG